MNVAGVSRGLLAFVILTSPLAAQGKATPREAAIAQVEECQLRSSCLVAQFGWSKASADSAVTHVIETKALARKAAAKIEARRLAEARNKAEARDREHARLEADIVRRGTACIRAAGFAEYEPGQWGFSAFDQRWGYNDAQLRDSVEALAKHCEQTAVAGAQKGRGKRP